MFKDMKDVCLGGVNLPHSLDAIKTSLLSWKKGPENHQNLHEIMESWLKNQQMDARYSLTCTELCQIGFSKSKLCVVCHLKKLKETIYQYHCNSGNDSETTTQLHDLTVPTILK